MLSWSKLHWHLMLSRSLASCSTVISSSLISTSAESRVGTYLVHLRAISFATASPFGIKRKEQQAVVIMGNDALPFMPLFQKGTLHLKRPQDEYCALKEILTIAAHLYDFYPLTSATADDVGVLDSLPLAFICQHIKKIILSFSQKYFNFNTY